LRPVAAARRKSQDDRAEPLVLVEVTSDSSEDYDTVDKLTFYRTTPSLREYVVVSHRERRLVVHTRDAQGEWETRTAISGGSVKVASLDAELFVHDVYRASTIA
jgi:Uma2 family endonuclease